jgi:hypothetical protein
MRRVLCISILLVGLVMPLVASAQPTVPEPPEILYTPDSSVRFALQDLQTIPPDIQPYIRYLSLYNIPRKDRKAWGQTLSFVCNSLGTRRKMYIPAFVGGSDETVIRVNLQDYEWDQKSFDKLAQKGSGPRAQPEPYFHALIEKLDEYETQKVEKSRQIQAGMDQYNRPTYKTEKYFEEARVKLQTPKKKKILAGAPWLDGNAVATLIRHTQAEAPILRADWFVANVTVPPAYYDFLRLGNDIKDFDKLVFADEKKAEEARQQDKAVVVTSIVARNNRTLIRSPTFTSGYRWASHDSLNSVDDRQYVRNLLDEKFDATEDIGTLPNGLQAYFLTDGKGKRLDVANPDIAIDNTAVDRLVRTGRSCIICHAAGIIPIDDEVRALTKKLQNRESIKLLAVKHKDLYRVEDLFGSDLDARIAKDQQIYTDAVAACNSLKPEVNAKQYARLYDEYAEHLLTKDSIVRETGVPPASLENYIRLSQDNVVLGMIKNPVRPVRRDQWERSFGDFMLTILAAKQVGQK